MTGFARQHDYHLGRALALAAMLVIVGSWVFPVEWLRYFSRSVELEVVELGSTVPPPGPIRLIPVEALELGVDYVRKQTTDAPDDSPDLDESFDAERHEWAFDPTTAWQPLAGWSEPMAGAVPDSVRLRADLLNSLRLANWGAVFAMLDTTQTGRAREQFAETDRWVNRYYGPVWTMQGRASRISNLWYRAVHEAEAEGSH